MSSSVSTKRRELRHRRHVSVRKRISGTAERPRLAVFRSSRHKSAKVIDDVEGRTLAYASTMEKDMRASTGGPLDAAGEVGRRLAARAKEAGVDTVVFDRGGFKYHGRVAALGDAAREAGLKF